VTKAREQRPNPFGDRALVTAKEIAAILGCSQKFVRRITDTGHFPKDIQIGPRMRRWRRVEVEAWLNAKEAGLG